MSPGPGPGPGFDKNTFVYYGGYYFQVATHIQISDGAIGMGNLQRRMMRVAVRDTVDMTFLSTPHVPDAIKVYCTVHNFDKDSINIVPTLPNDYLSNMFRFKLIWLQLF